MAKECFGGVTLTRVAVLVEGPTEGAFVKQILARHLLNRGVYAVERPLGGDVSVCKMARDIRQYSRAFEVVTSLVDYYGFKGKGELSVQQLERKVSMEARNRMPGGTKCTICPYVQRHEFEGLLFSDVEAFGQLPEVNASTVRRLKRIRDRFQTPEDINDGFATAPSKRIKNLIPTYDKVVNGLELAEWATLARIRRECKRFNAWVAWLESLGEEKV